jgi:hypothetical protein
LVKGLDDGVIPAGRESSHIEGSSDPGTSTPDHPFAPEAATVSIERGNTRQSSNLVAAQSAQFRKVGQKSYGDYSADSWDAAQQIVLLSPEGTLPQDVVQILIQATQLLLQPADMLLEPLTHRLSSSSPKPVLLSSKHFDDLVPPGQEGSQFLRLGIRQGMWVRSHCLSKVGQYLGIQSVRLGQPASSSGKVPNLAGIDHGQGQPSSSQSSSHWHLESASSLQYHQFGMELRHSLDRLSDARSVISYAPSIPSRTHSDIQPALGYVDTYVRTFRFQ